MVFFISLNLLVIRVPPGVMDMCRPFLQAHVHIQFVVCGADGVGIETLEINEFAHKSPITKSWYLDLLHPPLVLLRPGRWIL